MDQQKDPGKWLWIGIVLLILLVRWQGCSLPVSFPVTTEPTKPTAVTYVYEQRKNSIPNPIAVALDTLNSQGVIATTFDKDTVDGTSEVPDQYKVPLAKANEVGLPALVSMAGDKVIKVVSDPSVVKTPKDEAAVMEALK